MVQNIVRRRSHFDGSMVRERALPGSFIELVGIVQECESMSKDRESTG
jgi:hypothetical protein